MIQTSLRHRSYSEYIELARTSFPVERTINVKINITYHRVKGDGCIWEEI